MRIESLFRAVWAASAAAVCVAAAWAGEASDEFERQLLKSRFQHEIAFREAAIHVAWGAEPLCDDTTEIEPFVLWSAQAVPRGLSARQKQLLQQATGMDDKWRIVWLDESAPDDLKIGDVVTALNDRPLPAATSTRFDVTAVFRGKSPLAGDDQGFWDVLLKARAESLENGKPMVLTLEDGRKYAVPTQSGCAGSVVASAFDHEPDVFWRQGNQRVKIPGNALMEARQRDEFRWLAAFGTYFQASERAIGRQQAADEYKGAFVVGKVLALAVPGGGVLMAVAERETQRAITVDGLSGSADLFATEVVTALGGDPKAGLALNERMKSKALKVDELLMTDFRRGNAELHVQRLREIQAQREQAERDAEQAVPGARDKQH